MNVEAKPDELVFRVRLPDFDMGKVRAIRCKQWETGFITVDELLRLQKAGFKDQEKFHLDLIHETRRLYGRGLDNTRSDHDHRQCDISILGEWHDAELREMRAIDPANVGSKRFEGWEVGYGGTHFDVIQQNPDPHSKPQLTVGI